MLPNAARAVDPYEVTLREAGVAPTKEGLSNYLLSLIPSEENEAVAQELVRRLGHNSFAVREAAEVALASMPNPPLELLQNATQSDDPETRYRARSILAKIEEGGARSVPNAAHGYIARHQVKGLAFPILQFLPYSGEASAFGLTSQAVLATITKDDVELLRRAIKRKHNVRRAIAVQALAKLQGVHAIAELTPLLKHEDALVRLAAAQSLANLGGRAALATLVDLLEAEDLEIRTRSASILESFTHQQFQFVAYAKPDARAEAVQRWRTWLAENGESAELHFPLKPLRPFHGRTLISLYPKGLREIDAEGNETMHHEGFRYAWGCHATPDGIRVMADFSMRMLVEYDASGKETLRLEKLPGPPADVRRLDNGHFLLALAESQKVVEMDREGGIVWSVDLEGRPTTVNRLDNGNTMVNLQFGKRVVEVDQAGEILWELKGMSNALTAQALPAGNVLVCEMNQGRVVEYNRDGDKVWDLGGFNNACQAQRLPNGNTLVSDSNGLHEYSPEGERVWHLDVPRGRFWRY